MDNSIEFHALPGIVAGRARGGRDAQQDDLICFHDPATRTYLLVLADGMGGDGAGELASQGVIEMARRLWTRGTWRHQPTSLFLESLCQLAHAELRHRQQQLIAGAPHSTIVALLVKDHRIAWAHVGDSRLYRFHGRRLMGRTEDHSLAQLKYRRGEISERELVTHADQQQLLRGLGGPEEPVVEHGSGDLRHGCAFVLCSDGAWTQLKDEELGRFVQRHDQHDAVRDAIHLAVERGGASGDNVSLIFMRPPLGGLWPALWQAVFAGRRRKAPATMQEEV
ncbi:PP2C family protein-serine/threonine phosphatase [Dyella japonica]|uniref:PP2C family protein-serine/threonine phosphatase n=1 Tax=Dyella japonica TaxID=231455 RepID=UPI0002D57669|nr:PP2C family serine/threonine-protein phosphatase [Dyella japonica]